MTALLLSSLLILFDGDRLPMPSLLPRGADYGRSGRTGAMRNPAARTRAAR
ncbi:MAG: hypothetical protein JF591_08625 [Lysobacter sp.]|nr:hypothetical protein [Lysobacter sp.]